MTPLNIITSAGFKY